MAQSAAAQTVKLYDGPAGTSPTQQGYLTFFGTAPNAATTAGGKTTLDTSSDQGIQAGFATHGLLGNQVNVASPVLDRDTGYRVRIEDLRINSESFTSDSRSGFSLIV